MKNAISYRGYTARVEFDPRDSIFVGWVIGVPEPVKFHGETVGELTDDFHSAVDHYIADCKKTGRNPHKSYSGKLMLRIPPEVHAHAVVMAETHGKSINQWAAEVLSKAS